MTDLEKINQALINAVHNGDLDGVKSALESGANINFSFIRSKRACDISPRRPNYEITALGLASQRGDLPIVMHLIESGVTPYSYSEYNCQIKTPRDWAKWAGEPKRQIVQNYLTRVMKLSKWLNKIDSDGYTPLTRCIYNKWVPQAESLMDFGADVCKSDKYGKTPLIYAIEKNSLQIFEKLLEKGAIASGISAVTCAIELKRTDILICLLNTKDIPLDSILDDGFTPLTKAINTQNIEIFHYLVEQGADPLKVDQHNKNPLQTAMDLRLMDLAKIMLSKCVNTTRKDGRVIDAVLSDGFTPLTKSIATYSPQMAGFLIENGADPTKVDSHGNNPMELAMEMQWVDFAKLIVSAAFPMDSYLSDGFTLLTKSIATYNQEMATYLIENGADLEKVDRHHNNPLDQAVAISFKEIVELLLAKGLKIPRTIKQSVLSKFVEDSNIEMFTFLLKNGWNVDQIDENGRTVLAMSANNRNLLLSRHFIENGATVELAEYEIEGFCRNNKDFELFMQKIKSSSSTAAAGKKENCSKETGQE